MELSIIIVNYKAGDFLVKCLKSIYDNIGKISFEVIIVDNNSDDGSIRMVEEGFPQTRLIKNKENFGFAKANNQAIRLSKARYILLLNPDTEILSGTIGKMVKFMDSHKDASALGCKLLNSDGTLQPSAYSFPNLIWPLFHLMRIRVWFPTNKLIRRALSKYFTHYWEHNKLREVDWVTGACIMLRKEAINSVGLLDENFFLYFEEIDWCRRAKEKGWKICFLPESEVVHHLEQSAKLERERTHLERYRSMLYYYKKYYGWWGLVWVRCLIVGTFLLKISILYMTYPFNKSRKEIKQKLSCYWRVVKG